ncbi:hypothetical protein E4191_18380 (plasmid) [Paracoccus liaowanqingii]|uniref:Mechanosensitive ion channel family protein n=1 Tax=Paracoccus liaowanqingii TaxID=2560053 RepID=A0A4Y5ST30_9RHOB|nr:hypothetical protein [Paracoccus liaowanqingii]QDA36093.1 hypothetical protein E4191_18380 [Paracoccus liaowanqingii]
MEEIIDVRADIGTILDKVEGWINGLIRLVPNLIAAALLLVVFYLLARLLSYAVTQTLARRGRPALANVGAALFRCELCGILGDAA